MSRKYLNLFAKAYLFGVISPISFVIAVAQSIEEIRETKQSADFTRYID